MNALEKIVSVLLGLAVMFLTIFTVCFNQEEKMQQAVITDKVIRFKNAICNNGYLSLDMWDDFLTRTSATGLSYTYDLTLCHQVIEPKVDDAGNQIGNEIIQYNQYSYTDDIIMELNNKGIIYFTQGDYIYIELRSTTATQAGDLRDSVYGREISETDFITANAGGEVRDENY